MIKKTIPATSASRLTQYCTEIVRTSGHVMDAVCATFTESQMNAMGDVLAGGGRIAIECSLDNRGNAHVALTALELEGARRVLAELTHKDGSKDPLF